MKKWFFVTLIVCILFACRSYQIPPVSQPTHFNGLMCDGLGTGNLLFVHSQNGDMDQAIEAATGQYTHVGIVECTDTGVFVFEALPHLGVVRHSLHDFYQANLLDSNTTAPIDKYYISVEYDTAKLISSLYQYLGQPYDDYFAADNRRMYCSELVYECFFDNNGQHLFSAQPMNFLDREGNLPSYWQIHFDSLGVLPPQGELGTNPTDMAKAPFLIQFKSE